MKVSEAILRRRSVRKFTDTPIPMEDLIKIVEAARWAPTAVNRQKTRFVVVTDEEILKKVADTAKIVFYKQKHAAQSKAMIVVCLDSTAWVEETGAAVQNILLMAYSLNIGSCWIGAFNEDTIRLLVKIPAYLKIIALISLGYASHPVSPPPRLPLEEIVHYNTYSTKDVSLFKKATKSGPFSVYP